MKKNTVIFLSILLLITITICYLGLKFNSNSSKIELRKNREYEQYLENEIYGTDVVTLINKAISSNEKNNVAKDENGNYIENNKNSIIIELVMVTNEEKNQTTTYRMEKISKVGVTEFIKNFNTEKFKCTSKDYHKETGKIAYIEITEQLSF